MTRPTYQAAGCLVVPVREIVDIANAARVRGDLTTVIRRCTPLRVVVDLHAAVLTRAGVEVLEAAHAVAVEDGKRLRVSARHPLAREVLRITGADLLLLVHADLPAALNAP
ncbi:STAS domain-containing protein [Streptomyces sp. CB02923]|uniref:STAS domain-containing protein n=1 Tax=Streptomyces sp. CB02923 TaxID=1718985 RepID=UPI0019010E2F|nr:STAS domain-containing protein [Streptomyces sp. CB02923]